MKNLLFGLIAIAGALSFSAFKNVEANSKLDPFYYINDPNSDNYVQFLSGVPDVTNSCDEPSDFPCAVQSDVSLGSSFDKTQQATNGSQIVEGAEDGLYQ